MNYIELEMVIKDSGLKKSFIADKIGITRQNFYLKLNGERQFSQGEIMGLKEVLRLSDKQFMSIFFNNDVGKMPTTAV